jgi:hypothetical protein
MRNLPAPSVVAEPSGSSWIQSTSIALTTAPTMGVPSWHVVRRPQITHASNSPRSQHQKREGTQYDQIATKLPSPPFQAGCSVVIENCRADVARAFDLRCGTVPQ